MLGGIFGGKKKQVINKETKNINASAQVAAYDEGTAIAATGEGSNVTVHAAPTEPFLKANTENLKQIIGAVRGFADTAISANTQAVKNQQDFIAARAKSEGEHTLDFLKFAIMIAAAVFAFSIFKG